jgi:hypothetical protein
LEAYAACILVKPIRFTICLKNGAPETIHTLIPG